MNNKFLYALAFSFALMALAYQTRSIIVLLLLTALSIAASALMQMQIALQEEEISSLVVDQLVSDLMTRDEELVLDLTPRDEESEDELAELAYRSKFPTVTAEEEDERYRDPFYPFEYEDF